MTRHCHSPKPFGGMTREGIGCRGGLKGGPRNRTYCPDTRDLPFKTFVRVLPRFNILGENKVGKQRSAPQRGPEDPYQNFEGGVTKKNSLKISRIKVARHVFKLI